MKKNFTEIEEIIENRIAELSKEYDLDRYDIEEIRTEAYRENGWSYDPFPLEDEEEEEAPHGACPSWFPLVCVYITNSITVSLCRVFRAYRLLSLKTGGKIQETGGGA